MQSLFYCLALAVAQRSSAKNDQGSNLGACASVLSQVPVAHQCQPCLIHVLHWHVHAHAPPTRTTTAIAVSHSGCRPASTTSEHAPSRTPAPATLSRPHPHACTFACTSAETSASVAPQLVQVLGACSCDDGWGGSDCSQELKRSSWPPKWLLYSMMLGTIITSLVLLFASRHVLSEYVERRRIATEENQAMLVCPHPSLSTFVRAR